MQRLSRWNVDFLQESVLKDETEIENMGSAHESDFTKMANIMGCAWPLDNILSYLKVRLSIKCAL